MPKGPLVPTGSVARGRRTALGVAHHRQELKQHYLRGDMDAVLTLPDASHRSVGQLAEDLLVIEPGQKLVYATDFADLPKNRNKLIKLAYKAHTLFCEASFLAADVDHAKHTQHLTTQACAGIATAAEVKHLIPFHFSRRYDKHLQQLYDELTAGCAQTQLPRAYPFIARQ